MLPPLIVDRFVLLPRIDGGKQLRTGARSLDLASGQIVVLRRSGMLDEGHPHRWAERCAALFAFRHPHVLPLVDFGDSGEGAFEAFAAPGRLRPWPERTAGTARIVRQAMTAYHSRGLSAGHLRWHMVFALDARLVLLPDTLAGTPLAMLASGGKDDEEAIWSAELARCQALFDRCRGGRVRLGRRDGMPLLRTGAGRTWDEGLAAVVRRLTDVLDHGVSGRPREVVLVVPSAIGIERGLQVLAREARLHGYVPLNASLVNRAVPCVPDLDLRRLLPDRHVVLFDMVQTTSESTALFFAGLGARSPRPHVLARLVTPSPMFSAGNLVVPRAAEPTAAYHLARPPSQVPDSTAGSEAPLAYDERGAVDAAARAALRGRHAAAERILRRAAGASMRRLQAAAAAFALRGLGQLHLVRGRAAAAADCFDQARRLFERAGQTARALESAAYVGLAWTDAGRFEEAEAALRAASVSSGRVGAMVALDLSRLALARCLLWLERPDEALALLDEPLSYWPPEQVERSGAHGLVRLREACPESSESALECIADIAPVPRSIARDALRSRAALAVGDLRLAMTSALAGHEEALARGEPVGRTLSANALARVHLALGDITAVRRAVAEGVEAARASHAPLRALGLRLVLWEAVRRFGPPHEAARWTSRVERLDRARLPAVLRLRIERLLGSPPEPASTRSSVSIRAPAMIDALVEILETCQGSEDEAEQLRQGLDTLARCTRAVSCACFGLCDGQLLPLGEAGAASAHHTVAARCAATGTVVPLDGQVGSLEAAFPVRHAGAVIGVVYSRWAADIAVDWLSVAPLLATMATTMSPVLRSMLDRRVCPASEPRDSVPELIGCSDGMVALRREIGRVASAPFNVLIEGESGVGKELVARALHRLGARRHRRFCALNCAALSDELLETELFGHVKGAFTGAIGDRKGLFEEADGGTVLLDEVGELSARAQAKLLRAIQEGEVRRVGENQPRAVDVRIIAATNRALSPAVGLGLFRQDLLYRLAVIRLVVPPLRERPEDIPLLAVHFWRTATERVGSRATLGPSALAALSRYDWPGNVRELQNVMAALAVGAPRRGSVGSERLPATIAGQGDLGNLSSLDEARRAFETRYVRAALARAGGNRGRAARDLGLTRQGFAKLLARLDIGEEPGQKPLGGNGSCPNTEDAQRRASR